MKKKNLFIPLIVCLSLGMTVCGVNAEEASGDKVITISYWVEPVPEWDAQVLADTGITVEYEQIESKNYNDIMTTRLQGGSASDIFYAYNADAQSLYIDAGYALDLTDYDWVSEENIAASVLEDARTDGEGRIYSISEYFGYANQLWYNKDIFEENNIPVPQNMDELFEVCQQLLDLGITPFIHGASESNHLKRLPLEPITIIEAQEGGYEWLQGLATGESKFTDDIFVKASKYFEDMITKGYLSDLTTTITHVEAWELFCSGEAAMMTGESFYADQNYALLAPEFELGVVPAPYNYEGEPVMISVFSGNEIMANANSENRAVIEEYLQYYFEHFEDFAAMTGRPMSYSGDGGDWAPFAWMFDEWQQYPTKPYLREPALIQKDLEAWEQGILIGEDAESGLADMQQRLEDALK